jgi:hypothetical protein
MPGGTLGIPCVGEFKNGRGDFYDQESINGKTILVRFPSGASRPTRCNPSRHFQRTEARSGKPTGSTNIRGSRRSSLFVYATVEAFLVNLLVDVASISDRFASALLGTLFGLAFHPIKNCMEHALRRYRNLDEVKRKCNAPTDAGVSREA